MSQKKSANATNTIDIGHAGDTTTGPISLSDITAINPSFLNLINGPLPPPPQNGFLVQVPPQPQTPGPSEGPSSTRKRSPGEVSKQLHTPPKKLTLKSSQETIDSQRQEILKLKLLLHQSRKAGNQEIEGFDYESNKQDLIEQLLSDRETYRKQAEDRVNGKREDLKKTGKSKDAACQTDLNIINIDELIKASVTLKRRKEEQATYPKSSTPQPPHRPQVQQLYYPSVSLSRNDISNRNLRLDEKASLERLYHVNGKMTTVLNKLRAASDTG